MISTTIFLHSARKGTLYLNVHELKLIENGGRFTALHIVVLTKFADPQYLNKHFHEGRLGNGI